MRPPFFQNLSGGSGGGGTSSPSEVVLNVTGIGTIVPMYQKNGLWVQGKMGHLTTCNDVKINYSYLGSTHFCNYRATRQLLGNKVRWTFKLQKVTFKQNTWMYDIDQAAFWDLNYVIGYPMKSPIMELVIEVPLGTDTVSFRYIETLADRYMNQTGNQFFGLAWWKQGGSPVLNRILVSLNESTNQWSITPIPGGLSLTDFTSDMFNSEAPMYAAMGIEGTDMLTGMDFWGIYDPGEESIFYRVEAVVGYRNAFDMNAAIGASGKVCRVFADGTTGPTVESTTYKHMPIYVG